MELEEEEMIMREDPGTWDAFKDAAKFVKRDQIIKKRKEMMIAEEKMALKSDRELF